MHCPGRGQYERNSKKSKCFRKTAFATLFQKFLIINGSFKSNGYKFLNKKLLFYSFTPSFTMF